MDIEQDTVRIRLLFGTQPYKLLLIHYVGTMTATVNGHRLQTYSTGTVVLYHRLSLYNAVIKIDNTLLEGCLWASPL